MNLINLHNRKKVVYLFLRDNEGKQIIKKDTGFFPYYYEPDPNGKFNAYDGTKLRKIFVSEPGEVRKRRSDNSYEADIIYTRRYMIDKVKTINEAPIRYMFLDIEVLTKEFPNYKISKAPISCITVYDSFTKKYNTWYMGDMPGETKQEKESYLLSYFVDYMNKTRPDIWLSWNVEFDYNYLQARVNRLAQKISPLHLVRLGDHENQIFYPAGISILDYLQLFKKVHTREKTYQLDHIAQKYLGDESWKETKFDKLAPEVKDKNIHDVERMVQLEEKFKLIPYFNQIRKLSKCQWEDFCVRVKGQMVSGNSRIVEMVLFDEAKKQNVILPNKPYGNEKQEFEGAFRDIFSKGAHFNIGKVDLSSAYPNMIKDFCLDIVNINDEKEGLEINGTYFKQDTTRLLPKVIDRVIKLKHQRKKELDQTQPETEENKNAQITYDAIKAVLNSCYGVMGNRFFRLYDNRVASGTTWLVRNLLHYVLDRAEKDGIKILYVDTDSCFYDQKKDITSQLNTYIVDWGKKFGKDQITTQFDFEGYFKRLLLLAKCRYYGELITKKGPKEETKGLETKRADSTKFMAEFQKNLINKILDKTSRSKILTWINSEAKRMKTLPIEDIAFPCKIGKKLENYKNVPIFVRALEYTNEVTRLEKLPGELFYYIYIKPTDYQVEEKEEYYIEKKTERTLKSGKVKIGSRKTKLTKIKLDEMTEDERKNVKVRKVEIKKANNVIAFDKDNQKHVKDIDWEMIIGRNILNKVETLFEALDWTKEIEKVKGGLEECSIVGGKANV